MKKELALRPMVSVYDTERMARKKFKSLKQQDKGVHSDFKKYPRIYYDKQNKKWFVEWCVMR